MPMHACSSTAEKYKDSQNELQLHCTLSDVKFDLNSCMHIHIAMATSYIIIITLWYSTLL